MKPPHPPGPLCLHVMGMCRMRWDIFRQDLTIPVWRLSFAVRGLVQTRLFPAIHNPQLWIPRALQHPPSYQGLCRDDRNQDDFHQSLPAFGSSLLSARIGANSG